MTEPLAFRATYADWKLIRTRGVVQVVMEVPLADSNAAYGVLGGMPNPAKETWFGIAPLKIPQAEKETKVSSAIHARPQPVTDKLPAAVKRDKRDWRDVPPPQQAGIRINEPSFAAYLREEYPEDWREAGDVDGCLKIVCQISSKKELESDKHRKFWESLDKDYQAWLIKERA